MSQSSNKIFWWLKTLLLISLPLIFLAVAAWIGGAIFMAGNGYEAKDATPLTLYQYWYYYGDIPKTKLWLMGSLVGGLIITALPCLLPLLPKKTPLHGNARWANSREIREAGLFSDDGIIVGVKKGFMGLFMQYLVFSGSQHVLMAAPTRSGKGVSIVVPNLLSWRDSVVVLDIKQENWDITSGFRSRHGQDCFLLNLAPRDYRSHRWNPLFYISDDPNFRINDIQKIGQMLFPKIENEAPIWQSSARSLWLGMVLYLIETEELPVTMGEALRQLTMGDERLAEIVEARQESETPLSDECYLALKEYLDTPDKTRGSVRKGFTSALELFYNPVIDAVTSDNDFDLRELRKRRMSIYVGITPDDLERLAPLINLFFQQVIDLNTRELPEQNPDLKYQVLMLMDEFTAMGKVNILSKGISYVAGYGLRMLPIIQSPAQLRETYGHDAAETFIDNHALQIVFAPKNLKIAKEVSESLGTKTVKARSRSRSTIGRASGSENTSETGRALLMPQELKQMGKSKEIILLEDCPPIQCSKITWYKDPTFEARGNGRDGVKFPSPEVTIIDPANRPKGEVSFMSNRVEQVEETKTEVVERAITVADIENIDKLNLDDFSCDFSKVEIPKGDITDDAMDDIVNQFFSGLEAA
ncbi:MULTISPECIES: type IV secretory system conjugative DNA transfer family protein [Enterobacteriaceae]|nr:MULTISPECIES: type IV secretory system conjugative DNA transfer family protein [Enterobacteriaceae]